MNWELVRIGIDVLSVLIAVVMVVVLWVAYKAFNKVRAPLEMAKSLMGSQEAEEDEEEEDGPD